MSEAKDWAGELISGQTGTGRILVSQLFFQAAPAIADTAWEKFIMSIKLGHSMENGNKLE